MIAMSSGLVDPLKPVRFALETLIGTESKLCRRREPHSASFNGIATQGNAVAAQAISVHEKSEMKPHHTFDEDFVASEDVTFSVHRNIIATEANSILQKREMKLSPVSDGNSSIAEDTTSFNGFSSQGNAVAAQDIPVLETSEIKPHHTFDGDFVASENVTFSVHRNASATEANSLLQNCEMKRSHFSDGNSSIAVSFTQGNGIGSETNAIVTESETNLWQNFERNSLTADNTSCFATSADESNDAIDEGSICGCAIAESSRSAICIKEQSEIPNSLQLVKAIERQEMGESDECEDDDMSAEELNVRAEAFIQNFYKGLRCQRQQNHWNV